MHFYPRSPCGERPPITLRHCTTYLFLSTLSLRRATSRIPLHCLAMTNFYPRSPCGERPALACLRYPAMMYFYPRSPCGERPRRLATVDKAQVFLSTLSLRRATSLPYNQLLYSKYFYPRSPCGERPIPAVYPGRYLYFYPRSPCGERRVACCIICDRPNISIHALLAESDLHCGGLW